jgi:hypothetical protein
MNITRCSCRKPDIKIARNNRNRFLFFWCSSCHNKISHSKMKNLGVDVDKYKKQRESIIWR